MDSTEVKNEEENPLRMKLEDMESEMEALVYAVGHDLKAPLRSIVGFSSLLSEKYQGRLDPQAEQYLTRISVNVQKMESMMEDFVNYGRAARNNLQLEEVNCAQLVQDILASDKTKVLAESKITIDDLPALTADSKRLALVFWHLIQNAVKFSGGKSTANINISAKKNGNEWRFAVKDNGIGIDPKDFERIFKVFQKLHTQSEYTGNGIGLAIGKKVIELHGGKMWVESKPGKGSTFFFTVPERIEG